jgi:hypothetical protein
MIRRIVRALPVVAVLFLMLFVAWGALAAGGSVACQTQAFMDAVAANVTNHVKVPECFTGVCYPITLRPGDLLPGDGNFYIDSNGNTWSLGVDPGGEDGNGHPLR